MTFAGIPWWAVVGVAVASAAVLVVLHLLRVQPRSVRTVTIMFWDDSLARPQARTLWQRFRHPWTFIFLALICTLLALALGEPRLHGNSGDRLTEVIVFAAGSSMGAPATSNRSRMDAARDAVWAQACRLAPDDRLAIVVADPIPRVLLAFDESRVLARQRLFALRPPQLPAARENALRLAQSLLNGVENARIVVLTDQPDPVDAQRTTGADVVYRYVGESADNAAIISVNYEFEPDAPLFGRFAARIGYWGRAPRSVQVRISRAGGARLLDEVVALDPGGTRTVAVKHLPADGDTLVVELLPGDGLTVDDRTTFRLPLRNSIPVWIDEDVPEALRVALISNPYAVLTPGEASATVVARSDTAAVPGDRSAIVVVTEGPEVSADHAIHPEAHHLVQGLDFADASCGTGATLGAPREDLIPLLRAGDQLLAAFDEKPPAPRLLLASSLLAPDSDVTNRSVFPVFLARALALMNGWQDAPLVQTPEGNITDPLWPTRTPPDAEVTAMPGSRTVSDLTRTPTDDTAQPELATRYSLPAMFQSLLLIALVGLFVDALLHTRGRVP